MQILEKHSEGFELCQAALSPTLCRCFCLSQQDRGIEQLGFDPWNILNSNPVFTILPKQAASRGIVYHFLFCVLVDETSHVFCKNCPVGIHKNLVQWQFFPPPDSRIRSSIITNMEVLTDTISGHPCPASPHTMMSSIPTKFEWERLSTGAVPSKVGEG